MEYLWLTQEQIEELVNPILAHRGMAMLNINPVQPTCRVLGAWDNNELIEVFVVQTYPLLGPLLKIRPEFRDDGHTSRVLTEKMQEFLTAAQARAYLVIADSPFTERLCERFGMARLEVPVFSYVRVHEAEAIN